MESLQLKAMEQAKVDCAKRFFETLSEQISSKKVSYSVVDSFKSLMNIVR